MTFTRREKHVTMLLCLSVLFIIFFGEYLPSNDIYQYLWLIFFVVPLGIYVATDPERKKKVG
jgi:hypothetical protein